MKTRIIIGTILIALGLILNYGEARAQSGTQSGTQADELQKFEIGGHFSSLTLRPDATEPGIGVRFTYNVNRNLAFEAEGTIFPHDARQRSFRNGGRAAEGLFGVKFGKRYQRFGIFAKARPGLISFTRGRFDYVPNNDGSLFPFDFRTERVTHLAFDVGGVVEFYPSRRIFTRLDAGDTITVEGETTVTTFQGPPAGPFVPVPFTVPGEFRHNFQFSAGVGFRF